MDVCESSLDEIPEYEPAVAPAARQGHASGRVDGDAARPPGVVAAQDVLDGPILAPVYHDLPGGGPHHRVGRSSPADAARAAADAVGRGRERAAQGRAQVAGGAELPDLRHALEVVHVHGFVVPPREDGAGTDDDVDVAGSGGGGSGGGSDDGRGRGGDVDAPDAPLVSRHGERELQKPSVVLPAKEAQFGAHLLFLLLFLPPPLGRGDDGIVAGGVPSREDSVVRACHDDEAGGHPASRRHR